MARQSGDVSERRTNDENCFHRCNRRHARFGGISVGWSQGPAGPPGPPAINLWAVVNGPDGTLARGSGVTAAGMIGFADYVVSFNRDVSRCAYLATAGTAGTGLQGPGGILHVSQQEFNPTGVRVRTHDENAMPAIRSFHLAVVC
jgi:hypothetical protein